MNNLFKCKWLNAIIKRHRVAEWTRIQDPYICCLQETYHRTKYTHRLKCEGMKKDISCKWKEKENWSSNTYTDKIDFKTKAIVRDKEGHCIVVKGANQQEDITLVNIYAPNIGTPKYVKDIVMDIKGEIYTNTVIRGF